MTKRVYFVAHGGMVQGVGFRYFTRKQANAHGITGWVRNTPNNKAGHTYHLVHLKDHRGSNPTSKVEGEAQGDDDVLQTFLKDVDTGPRGSKVVKLDTEERDVAEGETGFEVRH